MNAIFHGWPKALAAATCEETTGRSVGIYGDHLRAIVLTGSLARGEATFFAEAERWSLLGDAEFLLIFHNGFPLPPAVALERLCKKIEDGLLKQNLLCRICLSAAYAGYLRKLKPAIFAYELKVCGQVIWGEESILSLIPAFLPPQIPLEDAWRLLCNRMIEQLEVVDEVGAGHLSRSLYYRTIKLYLDMATSLLVFAGAYEPTYRGRAEKLRVLAASALPDDEVPFPLWDFAERVSTYTEMKLFWPSHLQEEKGSGTPSWKEAIAYVQRLWRWELVHLTGLPDFLSNRELLEGWMRLQPIRNRLQGWLSLLKRRGFSQCLADWVRVRGNVLQASPRYLVYAAASEIFFRLPELATQGIEEPEIAWDKLHRMLPAVEDKKPDSKQPKWNQLASEIARNYHEFLEGTRA